MDNLSYLNSVTPEYIDSLYQEYKLNPSLVDAGWRKFFEGFDFGSKGWSKTNVEESPEEISNQKELNVLELILGYRSRGHLFAQTNPVRERRKYFPEKGIGTFGLTEDDYDTLFNVGERIGLGKTSLRNIYQLLEDTYCRSVGVEYSYIRNPKKVQWLQETMEAGRNTSQFSSERKKRTLQQLYEATSFENYLGTKFVGQKRFSLEGAESLIPALDFLISTGADLGIQELILGMAHRGRLNVLTNILDKPYSKVFAEFEGNINTENLGKNFKGDVKYHLGYKNTVTAENGQSASISLLPNPSHLETVNPVAEGFTRAKIDRDYAGDTSKIVPVLIHGDAAFANQGVVYEVLQMSKVKGYRVGGTVHIVINNQVGFTTNYIDARSSTYCTDIAKITLSPVFHVNGDDVEAVLHTIKLAVEYRQKFQSDVFIDILCYRKHGHNEGDEPKFTQPLLYETIDKHPTPYAIYQKKLLENGTIDLQFAEAMENSVRQKLDSEFDKSKEVTQLDDKSFISDDTVVLQSSYLDEQVFLSLAKEISTLPADKKFFRKIARLYDERLKMSETQTYNWAMGELMAYATLLNEGFRVRISGQDVERGTFSHRHAVVTLHSSEEEYIPLKHINGGAGFSIYNSTLSEYGVLGYEYGYALANPQSLTIWEAQFGDFVNGAQIVLDQYIASAETKWNVSNGLVMLLPHGFEGQGPEHSSARIERFMELCADNNIQVANCTTPANFYHILRRQMKKEQRKPLVVFTPKSLLRHPKAVSHLREFTQADFQPVINDSFVNPENVKRILVCTGKLYYDLLEKQQSDNRDDTAIIRAEQLYPFPVKELKEIIVSYPNADTVLWVQEEPENMGVWSYISRKQKDWSLAMNVVSRVESSSTATGYTKQHINEQKEIWEKSFNGHFNKNI